MRDACAPKDIFRDFWRAMAARKIRVFLAFRSAIRRARAIARLSLPGLMLWQRHGR